MGNLWNKYKDSHLRLILLAWGSLAAGIILVVSPDILPIQFIRLMGVIWIVEGVGYIAEFILKRLEEQIKKRTK